MRLERLNILTCEEHKENGREKMTNRFRRTMVYSIRKFCEEFCEELEKNEIFYMQIEDKIASEMYTAIEECVKSTDGDEEHELEILLPILEKRIKQGFMRIIEPSSNLNGKEELVREFSEGLLKIFVKLYNVRESEYEEYLNKHNKIIPLKKV